MFYGFRERAVRRLDYIKFNKDLRFIRRIELDLSDARDKVEFELSGDVLLTESIDGEVDVYFNEKDSDFIELDVTRKMYMDFWRIYITNAAQVGKSCVILIGNQGIFDGVSDVARESTQITMQTALDLAATEAKQDTMQTALDLAATAAKQDTMETTLNAIEALSGINYSPSDDVLESSDAETSVENPPDWTKLKEFLITTNGYYRFKCQGKVSGGIGSYKMYKDGGTFGVQQNTVSGSYEAIALGDLWYESGELAQLYVENNGANFTYAKEMDICGTLSVLAGVEQSV